MHIYNPKGEGILYLCCVNIFKNDKYNYSDVYVLILIDPHIKEVL